MFRDDFYFVVMRDHPFNKKVMGTFEKASEADMFLYKCESDDPFGDYIVILHRWSYELNCYIGARINCYWGSRNRYETES